MNQLQNNVADHGTDVSEEAIPWQSLPAAAFTPSNPGQRGCCCDPTTYANGFTFVSLSNIFMVGGHKHSCIEGLRQGPPQSVGRGVAGLGVCG